MVPACNYFYDEEPRTSCSSAAMHVASTTSQSLGTLCIQWFHYTFRVSWRKVELSTEETNVHSVGAARTGHYSLQYCILNIDVFKLKFYLGERGHGHGTCMEV